MHLSARSSWWQKRPGNFDPLHFSQLFPSVNNDYDIPMIGKAGIIPSQLIEWGSRPKLLEVSQEDNAAVHFFLDDYRFESLWRNPARNLDALKRVGTVLSPDFSLWRDMPLAMQLWQVYRNRWLGCYWQAQGITVIPTISWSEPYDFCCAGVAIGSVVAISTVGVVADKAAHRLFRAGFEKMLSVLRPEAVLCYGSLDALHIQAEVPIYTYPTRWQQRKASTLGKLP